MPFFQDQKILLIHIPKTGGTSIEKYFSNKFKTKLGPKQLYFSYYDNTIIDEITKYRKEWKQILYKIKTKKSTTNKSYNLKSKNTLVFQKISSSNSINSEDSLEIETREDIPEFKNFRRVRLSKELKHSLQHLTWSEMTRYKEILWDDDSDRNCILENPYDRNEYDIITVVRNPYDRIISELLFRKILNAETILKPKIVFSKIKKFLEKQDDIFDNHKLPQYLYLINEMGQMIENITILHTETIDEDMKRIGYNDFNHHFQVSKCRIQSGITKYSNALNKNSIELINSYYKRDFELFGYKML